MTETSKPPAEHRGPQEHSEDSLPPATPKQADAACGKLAGILATTQVGARLALQRLLLDHGCGLNDVHTLMAGEAPTGTCWGRRLVWTMTALDKETKRQFADVFTDLDVPVADVSALIGVPVADVANRRTRQGVAT